MATEDFDKEFNLWSGYVTGEYRLDPHLTASAGLGYAERPPTLTELYAAQPFLAILQQGFTSVLGDPGLDKERLWQIDLGLRADYGQFRGGVGGFYAWVQDYITFRALGPVLNQPTGLLVQFVNTDLATLSGGELYGEYDWSDWLTPFARMSYVEGRDHSRGSRGFIPGSDEEPLPGIVPLETRLGLRFHQACPQPRWGVELAARIVDQQDRVATSLLEQETAGFTLWDLRSYWRATDSLLVVAGVENLTDKQYREHLDLRTGNGVFQPGVNFYFGFELSY
ncbi:MAG: TonB-dependent receptor [Planctomycetes bacterium]|nr:TonB-dependent receptor [Planctomycetota bacterium]